MTDIVREMIETRRTLHRRPEEGWCEFQTTALILERLRALGYKPLCGTRVINPEAVMGRNPKKVEAAIERAREAGVSEELLAQMEGYTGGRRRSRNGASGPRHGLALRHRLRPRDGVLRRVASSRQGRIRLGIPGVHARLRS